MTDEKFLEIIKNSLIKYTINDKEKFLIIDSRYTFILSDFFSEIEEFIRNKNTLNIQCVKWIGSVAFLIPLEKILDFYKINKELIYLGNYTNIIQIENK